jgi:hypothetical protein
MDKLNLDGKPVTLSMETLGSSSDAVVRELHLVVRGIGRQNRHMTLQMDTIFAVEHFPAS